MRKSKLTKLLAVFLVVIFAAGSLPVATSAAPLTAGSFKRTLEEVKELLNTLSYDEYLAKYANEANASATYTIDAVQYDSANTTAPVKTETYDGRRALLLPDTGKAAWQVRTPASGMYELEIVYYPAPGKATSIERTLYIDGKVPFSEARSLSMTKVWEDVYEEEFGGFGNFRVDVNGNDIRPMKTEAPEWRTYTAKDSIGFYGEPFKFYFSSGDHIITLEAVREPIAIEKIILKPVEKLPTYEEYIAAKKAAGAKDATAEPIKINAENPQATSEQVIYPTYDRSSAISDPQDPSKIKLNSIGNKSTWQTVGQWVRYEVDIPQAGFYQIVPRFKQSELTGMFTSRSVLINGETPFAEARSCQFNYNDGWQTKPLNDGDTEFSFYLEAGKNVIEFEIVLGNISEILKRVNETVQVLNASYLKILKITGAVPDQYRDYNFKRLIPSSIINIAQQSVELKNVAEELRHITGQMGEHVATLNTISEFTARMSSKEEEIAKNLANLKSYLGTLGTWMYSSRNQPLEFDYIMIQPAGTKLPKAEANFFEAAWYEVSSFVLSFFSDYNTIGATSKVEVSEKDNVVMWVTDGRDQSQILRQLIDYQFTPETNIPVTLKLVAGGSLLPSILAGVGPDVTFTSSSETINFAIRSAVNPVDKFEGFDEVIKRFPEAAMVPLTLYGDHEQTVYGLPRTMSFNMMFYRLDVFADLNIQIPETWEDMYSILPILQNNKMEIAFPSQLGGTIMTLYQMDGDLYAENGKRINLDSNLGLTAFVTICDLFEKYRFPLEYDFGTRFRTGEMPLGIAGYTTYNTLIVYASELRNLWEMVPLLGWKGADGKINNASTASVDAMILPRGARNMENAWKLMEWFTRAETQSRYGNELVVILGPAGKYNSANIEAVSALPWTANEYKAIEAQMANLAAVPEYPGGYIIDRYVSNAFMAVYNDHADAVESMLNRIIDINKEISRKRKEFGMEYIEISEKVNFVEAASD